MFQPQIRVTFFCSRCARSAPDVPIPFASGAAFEKMLAEYAPQNPGPWRRIADQLLCWQCSSAPALDATGGSQLGS